MPRNIRGKPQYGMRVERNKKKDYNRATSPKVVSEELLSISLEEKEATTQSHTELGEEDHSP
jgi:hypothetical protein